MQTRLTGGFLIPWLCDSLLPGLTQIL